MNYRCPICAQELLLNNRTLTCSNNHCFDLSKYNTVNLFISQKKVHGDDKEMVLSRTQFLEKGYYENLRDTLTQHLKNLNPSILFDLGCGQGYYTNTFQQALQNETYGFDLSKNAIIAASKSNSNVHYAIASTSSLPVFDDSADGVSIIFAPYQLNEVVRVLKQGGYFIIVTPHTNHLLELKKELYDTTYLNEIKEIQHPQLSLYKEEVLNYTIQLENQETIQDLFKMTPYYYKTSLHDKEKLSKLQRLEVQLDFHIRIYIKDE